MRERDREFAERARESCDGDFFEKICEIERILDMAISRKICVFKIWGRTSGVLSVLETLGKGAGLPP